MKDYATSDLRSFAVLGHASAGKTMLAEAMMACSGRIGRMGSIAAGTLQRVIDGLTAAGAASVDYIHGVEATDDLGRAPSNIGVLLPQVAKDTFFDSIVADGALPRKTFSLGEAQDKRYYLEARAIR